MFICRICEKWMSSFLLRYSYYSFQYVRRFEDENLRHHILNFLDPLSDNLCCEGEDMFWKTFIATALISQCISQSDAFSTRTFGARRISPFLKWHEPSRSKSGLVTSSSSLPSTATASLSFESNSLSSVVGEADQSFRLGVELEKKGLVSEFFPFQGDV